MNYLFGGSGLLDLVLGAQAASTDFKPDGLTIDGYTGGLDVGSPMTSSMTLGVADIIAELD